MLLLQSIKHKPLPHSFLSSASGPEVQLKCNHEGTSQASSHRRGRAESSLPEQTALAWPSLPGRHYLCFYSIFVHLTAPGLSCSGQDLLAMACKLLVAACGIQFPDTRFDLGPLHWKLGVLATGPLGYPPTKALSAPSMPLQRGQPATEEAGECQHMGGQGWHMTPTRVLCPCSTPSTIRVAQPDALQVTVSSSAKCGKRGLDRKSSNIFSSEFLTLDFG